MGYTVSEYREGNREQILDLHGSLMQSGPRLSRSYLRWKYDENPYLTSRRMVLVHHEGQIVGMRGLFGTCWNLGPGSESVVLPHADDLIIHPEHRNRGLFLLIHNASAAMARNLGLPAMVSLSGGETTQKLSLITGWKEIGDLERLYRLPPDGYPVAGRAGARFLPLRAVRSVSRKLARQFGYSPGRRPTERAVDHLLRVEIPTLNGNLKVSREGDFSGMAALDPPVFRGRFRSVRTEIFWRWRIRNPDRKYRFLYWRDSRLRGYAVLAWTRSSPYVVRIADLASESDSVFGDLLEALTLSRHIQYTVMASTLSDSQRRIAQAAGFVPDPDFSLDGRRRFLFFPLTDSGPFDGVAGTAAGYPDKWRVGLIDTMGS